MPSITNSARKVYLYAAGGETIAVRWSAAALAVQIAADAALIPAFGAAGAALAIAISEAAIWLPLRRADPAAARLTPAAEREPVGAIGL